MSCYQKHRIVHASGDLGPEKLTTENSAQYGARKQVSERAEYLPAIVPLSDASHTLSSALEHSPELELLFKRYPRLRGQLANIYAATLEPSSSNTNPTRLEEMQEEGYDLDDRQDGPPFRQGAGRRGRGQGYNLGYAHGRGRGRGRGRSRGRGGASNGIRGSGSWGNGSDWSQRRPWTPEQATKNGLYRLRHHLRNEAVDSSAEGMKEFRRLVLARCSFDDDAGVKARLD